MSWPTSKKAEVLQGDVYRADCPTRLILDDVMSRWGSLVVVLLRERSYRFSELAFHIGGVSEKMLAQTLRRLEVDGFVGREVHATKPPKVQYSLTPLGRDLSVHVKALVDFVQGKAEVVMGLRAEAQAAEAGDGRAVRRRSQARRGSS